MARVIMSTEGAESSRKSSLALSAPRPICYLDLDFGLDKIVSVDGGADGKPLPPEKRLKYNLMKADVSEVALLKYTRETMARFRQEFRDELASQAHRTMVVDTFTAAWSGQNATRGDDKPWKVMEGEFNGLLQMCLDEEINPNTNVILIHHLKRVWAMKKDGTSYPSDTYICDSMDNIKTKVELAVRQNWVAPQGQLEGRFEMSILKARGNKAMEGQTFTGPLDFATLCSLVYPQSDWTQ